MFFTGYYLPFVERQSNQTDYGDLIMPGLSPWCVGLRIFEV